MINKEIEREVDANRIGLDGLNIIPGSRGYA
jgi:hypothetical protein